MVQRCFRYLFQWGRFFRKEKGFPDSPSELVAAWQKARRQRTLGFILGQARAAKNLNLHQLQTVTGISAPYLSKLERDLIARPSLFLLVQLAEVLELDLAEVVSHLAYEPEELVAMERKWRFCLSAQPGDRNGVLMLEAIALLWDRSLS